MMWVSLYEHRKERHSMNPASDSALIIDNAHKTYRNGFTALKGVSFDVKQGEFLVCSAPMARAKPR